MIYAVCTQCPFLRAYGALARGRGELGECPACGAEVVVRESAGRFPPAYVSRVSLHLLAAPELPRTPAHS